MLDPRQGGEFTIDINGVPVRGEYLEVEPPRRLGAHFLGRLTTAAAGGDPGLDPWAR